MGFITTVFEANKIVITFIALLAYPAACAIYNVYFHPLSKFPGPKLWAASRLPFIYYLLTGQLVRRVKEFHDTYEEFFRLALDEVSFASEQARNDIYTFRRGQKRAGRDKVWYVAPNNQADNLITTTDFKFHTRVQGLLSNSFTEESLRSQHPLIQSHADMLISKIREAAEKPENSIKGARINITDWLNFFTIDIIGDLAFGAPFGCLEKGEYHHWVRTLFSYLNGMSIAAAPRFYSMMGVLFQKLIPKSVIEEQKHHNTYAEKMINRRLDTKTDRPDFMTPFMRNNVSFENMSRAEIVSTFSFIIVGGSEPSATTMTDAIQNTPIPYLEAVLNEGLRICNPIPSGLPRVIPEGGTIIVGYSSLETRLAVRTFPVNRPKKTFTDRDEFVPERWLPKDQQPAKYANDQLAASKSFSVGFHSCFGRPLAWLEMRLAVTRLLWALDLSVEVEDAVDFDEFPVIMIIQKAPMNLRVRVRPGI